MKKTLLPVFLGLLGGLLGAYGFSLLEQVEPPAQAQTVALTESPVPVRMSGLNSTRVEALSEDFVGASARTTRSVVYIKTISETQRQMSWFDYFFQGGGTQEVLSSGSGVIFSEDGYVVTNNHVIENAKRIQVVFDKKPYDAEIIGTDPSTDLAVLKIEGERFPAIPLGKSSQVDVGEWVLAVGNPFNLTSTVTAGIVSAKGRDLGIVREKFPLESFIQTDAAINPGNSGGALVNTEGELVGINTAILSRTGSYAGYGFAVPIDIVKKIFDDLVRYGKVQKAFVGAEVADIDFETGNKLALDDFGGVILTYIHEGGAADKADLKKGDIIRKVNGEEVDAKAWFDELMSYRSPGDEVTLTVERDGKQMQEKLTLLNEDGTTELLRKQSVFSTGIGAELEPLSQLEQKLYKVKGGVRIFNIQRGMAAQIGIQDGFVLLSVNNERVNSVDQAVQLLESTRGRVVLQGLNKDGRKGYYSYYY